MVMGIVLNADKAGCLDYAGSVTAWLRARGVGVMMTRDDACRIGQPDCGTDADKMYRDAAFIVVLGGDGTMLRASRQGAMYDTPLLGINYGTMGYLTDVDRQEGLQALEKVLRGDYRIESRMMLAIDGMSLPDGLALNEVSVSRSGHAKLITVTVSVNGMFMDTLRADGLIVATPTGSTAYNLSAGGPIIKPDNAMMVVTAICPHALYTRPWVFAADDVVTVRMAGENGGHAIVSLDGDNGFRLNAHETVTIRRSPYTAAIMKTTSLGFFEILRRKMGQPIVMEDCVDDEIQAARKNYGTGTKS